jgi:hypothetical protein
MSSKVVSYYDWERGFKTKVTEAKPKKKTRLNSIGMTEEEFKRHLNKWKNENM